MKKLLAITLAFVLVLSLGAVAFAAGSPVKTVSTTDLPEESDMVKEAVVSEGAEVVSLKTMEAAQKAEANKAINAVVKEGAMPVDAFAVDTEDAATAAITLDEEDVGNIVIYVFSPDGKIVKLLAKDLVVREDGTYEIVLVFNEATGTIEVIKK